MLPEIAEYFDEPLATMEERYDVLIPQLSRQLASTLDPTVNRIGGDLDTEMLRKIDRLFSPEGPRAPDVPACDAQDAETKGYWGALQSLGKQSTALDWKVLARLRAARQFPDAPDRYEEAQIRELAFWRWVAFNGYLDTDPRCFPLWQRRAMLGSYSRTGWSVDRFAKSSLVEIGCGPLGMLEFLPARERVGFDPLNPHYDRLFSKVRSRDIDYVPALEPLVKERAGTFDFGICYNVIDHTDEPRELFDQFFSLIRPGGAFLFQVNLVDLTRPRSSEHTRMHPSTFDAETVRSWISEYADDWDEYLRDELSPDNEHYFMVWSTRR